MMMKTDNLPISDIFKFVPIASSSSKPDKNTGKSKCSNPKSAQLHDLESHSFKALKQGKEYVNSVSTERPLTNQVTTALNCSTIFRQRKMYWGTEDHRLRSNLAYVLHRKNIKWRPILHCAVKEWFLNTTKLHI